VGRGAVAAGVGDGAGLGADGVPDGVGVPGGVGVPDRPVGEGVGLLRRFAGRVEGAAGTDVGWEVV